MAHSEEDYQHLLRQFQALRNREEHLVETVWAYVSAIQAANGTSAECYDELVACIRGRSGGEEERPDDPTAWTGGFAPNH